jgi:tight adherence protein C
MPTPMLIAVFGVFVTVALAAGVMASWWLGRTAPELRRLRDVARGVTAGVVLDRPLLNEGPDPTLARLTRFIPKSPKDMSRLQRRLARAGYPRFEAAVCYSFAELLLPGVFGITVLLVLGVSSGWIYALAAATFGLTLPGLYIRRRTRLRQKAIQNALPDALDLLTICVEAGSGLDQAIVKASDELRIAHPALAEEMRLVTTETRAGKPRLEALKNLAQRTGVEDVRTLVSMLTQTDRFGTSIGEALRTHAETSRTKRRQRAEERAAKVSVKLVFPLALCLFPALYVVCFGSVVVVIFRAFFTPGAP